MNNVSSPGQDAAIEQAAEKQVPKHLEKLSWFMDQAIPVPGTKFNFGLDSIIGLIPGIGDAIGLIISSWVVAGAVQAGARRRTVLRMLFNIGRDALIGAIPLLGDLYDFGSKANTRNIALLKNDLEKQNQPRNPAREKMLLWTMILIALGLFLLAIVGFVSVINWLLS